MGLRITVHQLYLASSAYTGFITYVRLWYRGEFLTQLTLEQFEQYYGFRATVDLLRQ